jgi:hypothetical protein|tara:strand:+ start:308 stop:640 length:333 start_codon:yes stop_codon:yes gene_type:complete
VDFSSLLLNPIYDLLGVPATLTPFGAGAAVSIVVLDKTAGIDISGQMDMMALRPAAIARLADLSALGVAITDVDGGSITFNGSTWRIDMHFKKPTPDGAGELMMFLMDEA